MNVQARVEKEDDSHPYVRPRDAATLILIDRSGERPRVLVGRRHDKVVFMPGKYVFPGGRVDPTDHRIPTAAPRLGCDDRLSRRARRETRICRA